MDGSLKSNLISSQNSVRDSQNQLINKSEDIISLITLATQENTNNLKTNKYFQLSKHLESLIDNLFSVLGESIHTINT